MKTRFHRSIVPLFLVFSCGNLFAQDAARTEQFKQLDTHGNGKLNAGDHTRSVRVGELERRYRIYIPKKYDTSKATPVIVVFHGGGGNPESMIRLTGMNAKADEAGFVVETCRYWNALGILPVWLSNLRGKRLDESLRYSESKAKRAMNAALGAWFRY
ncbi:MAG: hypothetical protein EBV06_18125, partial [Planctomycetia bacterium]|nr:hypothetical protein [Planctomycetia bacterium]